MIKIPYLIYRYRFFYIGLCLSVIGMIILYSALQTKGKIVYEHLFLKQMFFTLIGWLIFWVVANMDYHYWKGLCLSFFLFSILLLILVLVAGQVRYGARRWIYVIGFTFQPSELAKISHILLLSYIFSIYRRFSWRFFVTTLLVTILVFGLIIKEPDLGTALSFFVPMGVGWIMSGISLWFLGGMVFGFGAMLPVFWSFLHDYQKRRVMVFLNPQLDPLGAGYTITQSRIAIGSGRLLGKGWMCGTQNKFNFIPERHSDFIFSVLAEEWGFLGVVLLIGMFFVLFLMALKLSEKSYDPFAKMVAVMIGVYFFFHSFVNIAMTCGFLPVVGLPLPFISYGGTSLLVSYFALGILQSIANEVDK